MAMSNQILYNTIGSSVTLFSQWLIIMLIPNIADFSDAGIFAIAISICSIMNFIATFFLNQYQISDQYEKFTENDYFVCRLFTIVLSFVLCFLTIPIFNYSMKQGLTIIAYMVYRNFLHLAYLHLATLQIKNHLDYAGKCMIIEGFFSLISFIITYIGTNDLVLSTFTMAIIGGGSFLILMSYGYRKYLGTNYPMKLNDYTKLWPMLKIGLPLLLSVISPTIITAFPKLILEIYWPDDVVGIFSTLTAPTIIIPTLVTGVFTPFIVHFSNFAKNNDMSSIKKGYYKTIVFTVCFCLLSLIVSLLLANTIFTLLYGDEISPYTHYFHRLIIGISIYSIGMCGITILITKNQGKEAAVASILSMVISGILFAITIPNDGMDAAVNVLLISYGVFALFITICVLKPLKPASSATSI